MTRAPRPILVRSVNFVWYPLMLVPILALLYFSFSGALPALVAPLALFAIVFWLCSLGFALWVRFIRRQPPELRQ